MEAEQLNTRPGKEHEMQQKPVADKASRSGSGKLSGKIAIITGGDSGIGRAVAINFAKEGATSVLVYLNEDKDAHETERLITEQGGRCIKLKGDIGSEVFCKEVVQKTIDEFGQLDVLINNAAEQHPQESIEAISEEQLERTFRTNIYAMFFLVKAALPHLKHEGASIINTASVVAFKGNPVLLDYSATKGAIIGFTRALALSLAGQKIRVNAVAPGPIWTPLIPSTFDPKEVEEFGKDTPLGRPGQPEEVAPAFVYLASDDASYITGQTIHVNGGSIVNA